jgi:signal transduction histidine kinase
LGDIRGGISVSVPLAPLLAIQHRRLVSFFIIDGIIWLAGLVGVGLGGRLVNWQLHYRLQAEAKLRDLAKLQGVIEMSGAVCHELNQPLQAICGYSELIMLGFEPEHPLYAKASAIHKQVERMGTITAKLMGITHYETKDYPKGKIVDIDKASRPLSAQARLDLMIIKKETRI